MTTDKKLKIIHTEASPHWGGQEIRIFEELTWFREQGHEMIFIGPDNGSLYEECKDAGFDVISIYFTKARTLLNVFKMILIFLRLRPNVVATHSSTDSWSGLIAAKIVRIKKRIRYRHVSTPVKKNLFNRWQYRSLANLIFTTGKCIRNPLIFNFALDRQKVFSFPTPVQAVELPFTKTDAKIRICEELGLPNDSILIGQISVFRGWKGHQFLIDCFENLASNNEKYHLVLIGAGPLLAKMKHYAAKSSKSGNIHFLGFISNPWLYYQGLDVSTLLSFKNEGVPQTILKSMSAGTSVLGTSVGGIPEIIHNEKTGILIEPGDEKMFADGILKLCSSDSFSQKLQKNAFNLSSRFRWENIGCHMVDVMRGESELTESNKRQRFDNMEVKNVVLIAHHGSWGAASNFRDMFSQQDGYKAIEINYDIGGHTEYNFGENKNGKRITIENLSYAENILKDPDTIIFVFDYLGIKLFSKISKKLNIGFRNIPVNIFWSGNPFIKHRQFCLDWSKKVNAKEYAMLDLLRLTDSALPLMQPYDLSKMDCLLKEKPIKKNDIITICHSPGHKGLGNEKGTEIIKLTIENLKKEFDNINFILLGGEKWVNNAECLRIKASCNIFIDKVGEMSAGGLGKSGIESICMGIPTISAVHKSNFKGMYSKLRILSGNTDKDLFNNLKRLITEPAFYDRIKTETISSRRMFSYENTISYLEETMNQ